VSERFELWALRIAGALLLAISAFGFANVFLFKRHGPGGDLGVIAGALAVGAFALARSIARRV